MAGQVFVNGQKAAKASDTVKPIDELTVAGSEKYVSRGGHKLEHALEQFGVEVTNLRAIDLGASTGGFTDCLLRHSAASVAAVDVGQGRASVETTQRRTCDSDGANERTTPQTGGFPQPFEPFDLAVIDCSFISLRQDSAGNRRFAAARRPGGRAGEASV